MQRFGIGIEVWNRMYAAQGGLCAICRTAEATATDHDHETGSVRALLCRDCNLGIGLLGEDPSRLRAAAEYLDAHAADPFPASQIAFLDRLDD